MVCAVLGQDCVAQSSCGDSVSVGCGGRQSLGQLRRPQRRPRKGGGTHAEPPEASRPERLISSGRRDSDDRQSRPQRCRGGPGAAGMDSCAHPREQPGMGYRPDGEDVVALDMQAAPPPETMPRRPADRSAVPITSERRADSFSGTIRLPSPTYTGASPASRKSTSSDGGVQSGRSCGQRCPIDPIEPPCRRPAGGAVDDPTGRPGAE